MDKQKDKLDRFHEANGSSETVLHYGVSQTSF